MELTTIYREEKNEEKNGLELYFEAIPTKEERDELKANGYKWNNAKKCWYIKIGATPKAPKVDAWQQLQALKAITDKNEFAKKIVTAVDYLNREEETARQKDIEYYFKEYKMLEDSDNYIILIEKAFSLNSQLWYDDETEAPANTFENFRLYNLKNVRHRYLFDYLEERNRLQTEGVASGGYDFNGIYLYKLDNVNSVRVGVDWTDNNSWACKHDNKIRYLTKEEEADYIKAVELITEDYEKRLQNYWNRYSKHVSWCGYWVNR